jgi:hypothetical protein
MEMYTIEPLTQPDELGPEELVILMREMKTLITAFEVAFQDIAGTVPVIDIDE